jgi:hypothetical protein
MNVKLLLDGIVRQTTVLMAQLSTAAGVRAPLSHVADQVFLSLTREIEAQGVGRKVVADMFGMALRAYQKKVQRLASSSSVRDRSLWEAVLEFVSEHKSVDRERVLERFKHDGARETIAVLTDLVSSGLIYAAGRGSHSVYGVTSAAERQRLLVTADAHAIEDMIWGMAYRHPGVDARELRQQIQCDDEQWQQALDALVTDGRATLESTGDGTWLSASSFVIRPGAARGWESAVLDHFQAITTAIGAKLARGPRAADESESLGGSTLRFQIEPGHPYEAEVLGLLGRVRRELDEFWQKVSDYNDQHPIDPRRRVDVCFYYGQSVSETDLEGESQVAGD